MMRTAILRRSCVVGSLAAASASWALQHGRRLEDSYEVLEKLGEGAYGVVYKGRCKSTGTEVAIKTVAKRKANDDSIRHEMAMLLRVGLHRGVAALLDHFETDSAFYMVMEYVPGGEVCQALGGRSYTLLIAIPAIACGRSYTLLIVIPAIACGRSYTLLIAIPAIASDCEKVLLCAAQLFDRIVDHGSFSEARAAGYIRQLADAVAFLHSQGLCHADIKPENLLLTSHGTDADVRLVDFGLTREARVTSDHKPGTWAYWPPEAFGATGAVGKQTDMWSIGCIFAEVRSGLFGH